jgi:putative transposase
LQLGRPGIFNTDKGVQFAVQEFTACLEAAHIRVSMDGRGRALGNMFIERLWRTVIVLRLHLILTDSWS